MLLSILRVLFGFVLACLAAGLSKVLFAFGIDSVISGSDEQLMKVLEYTALTATHHVLFAAPFALVAAAVAEWLSLRSWIYYVIAGLAISLAGVYAVFQGEPQGAASIGNQYAITAYVVTGLVAGLTYWLFAGRRAGDDPVDPVNFERPSGKPAPARLASPAKGSVPASSTGSKQSAAPGSKPASGAKRA